MTAINKLQCIQIKSNQKHIYIAPYVASESEALSISWNSASKHSL